ncbi:WD40 repeat-like protein [Hypoxylon trugodes]|uniref:WD40 repeat-like protein n=1 Tax=Hypoxylon trugodes TaxID=326681 RepID=UPI0021961B69|nr:WD40 repeat-like protein [Hypoxylon trugodes]KAI1388832.1 WD40 repeat-like protein [Hypoxylon trugodes]
MAVDAKGAALRRGQLIDLTLADEEEEGGEGISDDFIPQIPPKAPSFPAGPTTTPTIPNAHALSVRPPPIKQEPRQSQSYIPPPSTPLLSDSTPTNGHSTKRRKLQHADANKATSPAAVKRLLNKCLENQVFPHLERAIEDLDTEVYDIDKLGSKVIGRVADSEFERHFNDGNGRLPPEVEASVNVRVRELVKELAGEPEFRRPPNASQPPQLPARISTSQIPVPILPSIEKPLDGFTLNGNDHRDEEEVEQDADEDIVMSEDAVPPPAQTPPPRLPPKKKPPITPQQLRTRQKATQWQSGKSYEFKKEGSPLQAKSRWFGQRSRPYLPAADRRRIATGVGSGQMLPLRLGELSQPSVYHVDFSDEEVRYLQRLARSLHGRPLQKAERLAIRDLRHLLKKSKNMQARIVDVHRQGYDDFEHPPSSILKRSAEDIHNFLDDILQKQVDAEPKSFYLERDDSDARGGAPKKDIVPELLFAREIVGQRLGVTRRYQNFNTAFRSNREDHMEPRVEWTNCAGDIMTISWLSDATRFVCGTTTHSDSHNQQYNKPGNLLFGDAASNTLRAYPDHRIPRPIVEHGDNALASMRESQDPWLFTSVVSSDYDPVHDFVFTSSFDNTVKVWHSRDGAMALHETWHHDGRVNFVVANKNIHGSKVATAADISTRAVRVYRATLDGPTRPSQDYAYDEFSCKRVHGEDYVPSDKWAYFPSAIRWGLEPSVNHLLLIGYSPRSLNGDDNEIPEDKRDTGELCLWDTNTNTEVKVNSAATANVFEVVWHPSRPSFAAATSASQTSEKIEEHIRTQIRIFELNEMTGQYGVVKTLDCPAIDINELAIRPNSTLYSYIAAGCTDGRVYVWDSAGSDDPMCVLEHGDPVEEFIGDREHEDVGVKFIAWATTVDRLYTGSSDGVVKVWNIRHGKGVLIRDIIEVPGPITVGAFSPDFKRLLIGDGSGRVFLMDIDGDDDETDQKSSAAVSSGFLRLQLNGKQRAIRRPRPFIPHEEVPPPGHNGLPKYQAGQEQAREYLNSSQIILRPDPTIGAVQGFMYFETGLYRAEAHLNGDPQEPLLGGFEAHQRINQTFSRSSRVLKQDNDKIKKLPAQWDKQVHKRNTRLSLDVEALDLATFSALMAEGAELQASPLDLDYESSYYEED